MSEPDDWFPDPYSITCRVDHRDHVDGTCLCGARFHGVYLDVSDWRREHRCPAGSVGAYPRCPECGATGRSCVTDKGGRGRSIVSWHEARVEAFKVGWAL